MHPALAAVPEDQAGDAHLLEASPTGASVTRPSSAIDPPDGILLDIGGCAHLFGGEAKLRRRSSRTGERLRPFRPRRRRRDHRHSLGRGAFR